MVSFKTLPIQGNRPERLLTLLHSVASNELLTHKLYAEFLNNAAGISPDISDLCQSALDEDQDHLHAINQCIERLNGRLPNTQALAAMPARQKLTTNYLLAQLQKNEAFSVKAYNEICAISMEYDYQVFDLSYRNMNENMAHLDFVSNLLNNLSANTDVIAGIAS